MSGNNLFRMAPVNRTTIVRTTIGCILAALAGSGIFWASTPSDGAKSNAADKKPASEISRDKIAALGRMTPGFGIVKIGAAVPSRVERMLVREGQRVKAGEPLGYLLKHVELLASTDAAAARLAEAKSAQAADKQHALAQVQEAKQRIGQYEQPLLLQIQGQKSKVRQIEIELALRDWNVSRMKGLAVNSSVSEQDLKKEESGADSKREELAAAQIELERLQVQQKTDLDIAKAQLATAEAMLQKIEGSSQINRLERELQLEQARLEDGVLRSPIDGQVLEIRVRQGEIARDDPVLDIGDTQNMYVVAEVYQTDVKFVKVGQRATIRGYAFKTPLTGTVADVGLKIFKNDIVDDDPAAPTDARVVEVRVRLDESAAAAAYTNMQVQVLIDIQHTDKP